VRRPLLDDVAATDGPWLRVAGGLSRAPVLVIGRF